MMQCLSGGLSSKDRKTDASTMNGGISAAQAPPAHPRRGVHLRRGSARCQAPCRQTACAPPRSASRSEQTSSPCGPTRPACSRGDADGEWRDQRKRRRVGGRRHTHGSTPGCRDSTVSRAANGAAATSSALTIPLTPGSALGGSRKSSRCTRCLGCSPRGGCAAAPGRTAAPAWRLQGGSRWGEEEAAKVRVEVGGA